ncbi:hypothetical protein LAZ67_9001733 [Cordylochernes scorpioides]|uniref:DNA helicase Pif1-like 2B domain-containing protein n=1 Tax=Cordylochernes scorpioides TaxID=51811 RepID=A0ABY6KT80_9ARAC|nr:hypothetical protein LAZ67_9001733 [Cordylochernes scorpioides]
MRVHLQNDASAERFAKQLLNIGNGKMTIDPTSQCITLPTSFCTLTSSKEELIQKDFPNIAQNYRNLQWLSERAILAAKNIDVNDINFCVQNWVPGEERTYTSIDTVLNEDEAVNYPTEFLNCLDLPGFPPHVLQLKTGVPIILLRNINPPKLCNGTRLSVKTMMNNIIEATILNGKFKGQDVLLPRIPLFPPDLPFEFKRLQFPVRTAFSMTINKAQGQSLKVCGLNLEVPCFSHGQLYVASSRVGNPSNLYVYTPDKTGTYTCNSSNGLFRYLQLQQFQWFIQVPTPATVPMVYAGTYTCNSSNGLCRIFQGLISTLQLVKKLDRYPFRKKKRKIDSVEQEEKTMNIKKEAVTQVGSFFVQHLPRNPSMFSGEGVEDPRSWLKEYERVAKHNQWDETLCLANVYFYLTGTALKWYENNEESIQTWTEFMSQLENYLEKMKAQDCELRKYSKLAHN